MAKRRKKMSEEAILTALEACVRDSIGYSDSKLANERENVLKYYHGALPLPHHNGNSKYVSLDVYDAVESAKAQILEVYSGGSNIVDFTPEGPEDVADCKRASAYTDYVIWRQNDGHGICSDVLQDGLLARIGVAKVYWDECFEESDHEFEDASPEELDILLGDDETLEVSGDIYEDPASGKLSGTLTKKVDKSQVRIETIPPEEFLVSKDASSIQEAKFAAHRQETTQGDLIKEGYPESLVKKIKSDDSLSWSTEKQARMNNLGFERANSDPEYSDDSRKITRYEAYIELDVEGVGSPRLWKIIYAGDIILDKQQVNRKPFLPFVPLPLPHSILGQNFAKLCIPIQNARTVLIRGILDHTVKTNNPRTMVVKGALVNPREMLDNRIGGIVNVTRPDGLIPEPQANLNPYVFEVIKLLDEDKEDTTGISKLSQGLNKDAISKQNSEGMVENLVNLSMVRQKIIARNFAAQFIVPLYLEVYALVLENEKRSKMVDVMGSWQEVSPERWRERRDASVALKLGYGEQERDANETLGLHQLFSQDQSVAPMYPIEKRYNLLSKYLEKKGCKNVNDYLLTPDQVPPPQPPLELVLKEREVKVMEGKLEMEKQSRVAELKLDSMEQQMQKMFKMLDLMVEQRAQETKEFEAKSKVEIAHRELDIIESTPPSETKQSNIVSPNS